MRTNDIRLIAMDMDGTLLNEEQLISKANQEALQAAVEKGVAIAICSGRLAGDSSLFALDAGLSTCRILSLNGAYCLDSPLGQAYHLQHMEDAAARQCIEVLSDYDITYACFQPGGATVIEGSALERKKTWGTYHDREGAPKYRKGREALAETLDQGICKIVYVEDNDLAMLEEIRRRLLPIEGLDVTSSWSNNLELMPAGVCKGVAVRELAGRLGLQAENVMTLGDYDNDLSMIEYAGLGVAMGNASEAVKKAAQQITLSNHEDGVAEAIRRYVL